MATWARDAKKGLAVVAYRESTTATEAIRKLRSKLGKKPQSVYRLPRGYDGRPLAQGLIQHVEEARGTVLHVRGWEESFGTVDVTSKLYDLNFLREDVIGEPTVQVWWVSVEFRDALMRFATDTWSVVNLKLAMADEDEYVELTPLVADRVRQQLRIGQQKPIPWRRARRVRIVDLSFQAITDSDLKSLEKLTGLTELWLDNTQVSDLSPLSRLASLQTLSVSFTQVSDLSPLSGLASLQELDVSFTQVSDLSPLSGMASLQRLNVSDTQVSDLSPLSGLASLLVLEVHYTHVSDLSPLSGLASLQYLDVSDTQVSDLSPLSGPASLEWLYVPGTQVSDLSPLSGLASLQELSVYGTQVSDLSPLSGLASLKWLEADNTQVTEEGVDALKKALPKCRIFI